MGRYGKKHKERGRNSKSWQLKARQGKKRQKTAIHSIKAIIGNNDNKRQKVTIKRKKGNKLQ